MPHTIGSYEHDRFQHRYCLTCNCIVNPEHVTNDEKHDSCGSNLYTDNEILITLMQTSHGFRILHDMDDWSSDIYLEFMKKRPEEYQKRIKEAYDNLHNVKKNKGWYAEFEPQVSPIKRDMNDDEWEEWIDWLDGLPPLKKFINK